MHNMTVGVDIDDTVCVLAKEVDRQVLRSNLADEIIHENYFLGTRYKKNGRLLNGEDDMENIVKILHDRVNWNTLRPIDDATQHLNAMQEIGIRLAFVTNRLEMYTPNVEVTTRRWLDKYYNNYDLYFVDDKYTLCEEIGAKYMIDNNHEVLLSRKSDVIPVFYTGEQPTTIRNVGLIKYPNWNQIYKNIILDR